MKNKLLVLASLALFVGCSEKEYTKDELLNNQKALEEQIKVCEGLKDKVAGISDTQKNNCALVDKIEMDFREKAKVAQSDIYGALGGYIGLPKGVEPTFNVVKEKGKVEIEIINPESARLAKELSCIKADITQNKETNRKELAFSIDQNGNPVCLFLYKKIEQKGFLINKPLPLGSSSLLN